MVEQNTNFRTKRRKMDVPCLLTHPVHEEQRIITVDMQSYLNS